MIPRFPHFKKIGIEDRDAVEEYTKKYPPYSDFNFTSLWSWDTTGERMISDLDGNLVVLFTDYTTLKPFLSFLGTTNPENTARTLLDYAEASGIEPILGLMPEISIESISTSTFTVQEDRDNFDYIYSLADLSTLKGKKFETKRHLINVFTRETPEAYFKIVDLADTAVQQGIHSILNVWEENKKSANKEYEIEQEEIAIKRICESSAAHTLILSGVFLQEQMIAFSLEELLTDGYSICHFCKANDRHKGIYDFLMHKKALHLQSQNISHLNYEQDLGSKSLRMAKESFRPVHFLKKYTVSGM